MAGLPNEMNNEKDRNGRERFTVCYKTLTVIVMMVGFFISMANLYGQRVLADNEIKVHTEKLIELSQTDKNISELIQLVQRQIAVQESQLGTTQDDIKGIKGDIKEILKAVKA